jgi:hypothetical protein
MSAAGIIAHCLASSGDDSLLLHLGTNDVMYKGQRDDLELGVNMGWGSNIDRVRVSPDGLKAFGFSLIHPTDPVEFRAYDTGTQTWSQLSDPATMPVYTSSADWHPDSEILAVGTGNITPTNLILYSVVGGVVTKLADPAVPLPNESVPDLCWNDAGDFLYLAKANSITQCARYEWNGSALINRELFGVSGPDSPVTLRIAPGLTPRYLVVAHQGLPKAITLFDILSTPTYRATVSVNAKRGAFLDESSQYIFTVSDGDGEVGTDYVRVVEIGGSIGAETLTISSTASSQPVADPSDAAITRDGRFLAVAVAGEDIPLVYKASAGTPRTLEESTVTGLASEVKTVSWSEIGS